MDILSSDLPLSMHCFLKVVHFFLCYSVNFENYSQLVVALSYSNVEHLFSTAKRKVNKIVGDSQRRK